MSQKNRLNRFEKAEDGLREVLEKIGVTKKEVLENTPRRFIKFLENFSVKKYDDFKSFEIGDKNQMVVYETKFTSICEHHLLPYFGKVFIAYLPTTHVIGVSKITKLVNTLSKKPSIQEELTDEICNNLRSKIKNTLGVAVVMHGFHTCVYTRYGEGWLTTSALSGVFKHNPYAKQEFFDFIKTRLDKNII